MPAPLRLVALGWLVALVPAGCDQSAPSDASHVDTVPARGELTATIGSLEPIRFDLAGATCRTVERDGSAMLMVRARGTKRFNLPDRETPLQPHLVSARLPAELDPDPLTLGEDDSSLQWNITASLLDVTLRGDDYKMLQLIGGRIDGASPDVQCRASRSEGDNLTLGCERVHPFPWFAPGDVPDASFEANMSCRERSGDAE